MLKDKENKTVGNSSEGGLCKFTVVSGT